MSSAKVWVAVAGAGFAGLAASVAMAFLADHHWYVGYEMALHFESTKWLVQFAAVVWGSHRWHWNGEDVDTKSGAACRSCSNCDGFDLNSFVRRSLVDSERTQLEDIDTVTDNRTALRWDNPLHRRLISMGSTADWAGAAFVISDNKTYSPRIRSESDSLRRIRRKRLPSTKISGGRGREL